MGLNVHYFYKLTQRQFYNTVNGYRKKEDYLSRERWHIARKTMYAAMGPYLPKGTNEHEIITFPWEGQIIKKMSEEDLIEAMQGQEASELFWKEWDRRKQGKV